MTFLRPFVLEYTPSAALNLLKRFHYLKRLRAFLPADEPDLTVALALVRPGDCVIDAGANVGWYTKALSEAVGAEGLVVSVEPVPDTFEILAYCIRKLHLQNVRAVQCGLSGRDGTMSMTVPTFETGGHNFYQARIESPNGSVTQSQGEKFLRYDNITVRTLDALVQELPKRVSFVKCDVEGHELPVLEGSRMLLARDAPAWLIEVSGDPDKNDSSAAALMHLLSAAGYEPWIFEAGRLKRRVPGDRSVNYFFLRSSHLSLVREFVAPPQ